MEGFVSGEKDLRNPLTSRRQRELDRHRIEALEAAERLLVRQSYPSISVQQIAEESEFSVGYLYKLFPSKDELYLTLVEIRKTEILELLQGVIAEDLSFSEGLEKLVKSIQCWLGEHEGFARDNRAELMVLFRRHREQMEVITETEAQMERPVVALFQKGIDEGIVCGAKPEIMASSLRALIWGFMADDVHLEKEAWSKHADRIVQIILRTYSPVWKEHE